MCGNCPVFSDLVTVWLLLGDSEISLGESLCPWLGFSEIVDINLKLCT